jgi:hypothetical protein
MIKFDATSEFIKSAMKMPEDCIIQNIIADFTNATFRFYVTIPGDDPRGPLPLLVSPRLIQTDNGIVWDWNYNLPKDEA